MKVYLASKWEEHNHVKKYADQLRSLGHEISFPWFERHLGGTPLSLCADDDFKGVAEADVCIFIFEKELPYSGAMTELGLALAWDIPVLIVGEGGKRNVFTHHTLVRHLSSFEEAIQWLSSQ